MPRRPADVERAYAACEAFARSHYENFPVASLLLPEAMRPHVAAVYAFARVADDIADEGDAPGEARRVELAAWQARLHQALHATDAVTHDAVPVAGFARDTEPLELFIRALVHSIRELDLPIALFDDLVSAFGQDTMTSRYASWADVFDYCRRSANPVGRLVLRIAGCRDKALDRSSDALCTALQLTNFWQDFGRDYRAGRVYVPREVQEACGAVERELEQDRVSPAWRQALDACAAVTRAQFEIGREVCDGVSGRLRLELRFTWCGGMRILERAEREPDLLHRRPALGPADLPALLWTAARWPRGAHGRVA
jgi:phytoene synthase